LQDDLESTWRTNHATGGDGDGDLAADVIRGRRRRDDVDDPDTEGLIPMHGVAGTRARAGRGRGKTLDCAGD
jgi:hypothetical protein